MLTSDTLYLIFFLETMHGITFALSYSSSVEYARKLAPVQWTAFLQSLLYVVFFCVGPGVASLVGGFVMQVRSPRCC
jgi:glycerol uptake facilitator-like aquaporin